MSAEDDARFRGKVETTLDHLGTSLDDVKTMLAESSRTTGAFQLDIGKGVARLDERLTGHEAEDERLFSVVDRRFDRVHEKLESLPDSVHSVASGAPTHTVNPNHVAAGGAAGAGVGILAILDRIFGWFSGGSPP